MDLDEARALLGVTHDASATDVRRAYLRACKQHPPETDPQGFQRVRAAFERLTGSELGDRDEAAPPRDDARDGADVVRVDIDADADFAFDEPAPEYVVAAFERLMRDRSVPAYWIACGGMYPYLIQQDLTNDVLLAFAEAMAGLTPSHDGLDALRLLVLARVALVLLALGELASAHGLVDQAHALDALGYSDGLAAVWAEVRELDALARETRGPLAAALAQQAISFAPQSVPEIRTLAASAGMSISALTARVPNLAWTFARTESESPSSRLFGIIIGVVVILMFAFVCNSMMRDRERSETPPYIELRVWADIACQRGRAACDAFGLFADAVGHHDCAAMRWRLAAWLTAAGLERKSPGIYQIYDHVNASCPPNLAPPALDAPPH